MDRAQFYRTLGVRPDATASQIKEAYEERIRRYHLSDYDDEPEYVAMKVRELNEAYSQIMGGGPIAMAAKAKTLAKYFNKDSDHGADDFDRCGREEDEDIRSYKRSKHVYREEGSRGASSDWQKRVSKGLDEIRKAVGDTGIGESVFETLGEAGQKVWVDRKSRPQPRTKTKSRSKSSDFSMSQKIGSVVFVLIIVTVIMTAVFGVIGMTISNRIDQEYETMYEESVLQSVDRVYELQKCLDGITAFNYSDFLIDNEGAFNQYVEVTPSDQTYENWWGANYDLMSALGLEYDEAVFEAMSGDPEFYYNYSDDELTIELVKLMHAPEYSEIAGMTDVYSQSQIVDYISYLKFLHNVAEHQIDTVLAGDYVFAAEGSSDWQPAVPDNQATIDLGEWGELTIQAENGTVVEIN